MGYQCQLFTKPIQKLYHLAPGIESLHGRGSMHAVQLKPDQVSLMAILSVMLTREPLTDKKLYSDGGYYMPTATQQVLGNITPDWIGGLNNTFSYKGFTLNVLLDFVQGNEITSETKYRCEASGNGKWTTEGRRNTG